MTAPELLRASRRTALGGVLVGLSATGCEATTSADPPATGQRESDAEPDAGADPDADLVDRTVERLSGALALVIGAARAESRLADELVPWRLMHAAHLEALEAESAGIRAQRVRGAVPTVRSSVRRRETTLQRELAQASVAARSGALAALLATMSAAVAQQLAAPPGGSAR